MNEPKEENNIITKGVGTTPKAGTSRYDNRTTTGIDFRQEYAEGFQKRLYIQQIQTTALQNWYDGFPVEDIINKVEALGVEEITKAVKEQLQTTVQDWLKELKDMRDASRELNIDLLRAASSLARKDRERVE